jgi:hypothetical protein
MSYRDAATRTEKWPSAKKQRMETRVSQVKEYMCALIFIVSDFCIRDSVSILLVNCGLKWVSLRIQVHGSQGTQIRKLLKHSKHKSEKVCARHSEHCDLPPTDNVQNTNCFYKVCSDENIAFQCIFLKAKSNPVMRYYRTVCNNCEGKSSPIPSTVIMNLIL